MIRSYGRDNLHEVATISIALNAEESIKLAYEPHIVTLNCWYCSACCGPSACVGPVNSYRVIWLEYIYILFLFDVYSYCFYLWKMITCNLFTDLFLKINFIV
jgi:hypothetical protein